MIAILMALIGGVAAGAPASGPVDRVQLKEDSQVLERDSNDWASCVVVLPEGRSVPDRVACRVSASAASPSSQAEETKRGEGKKRAAPKDGQ